MRNIGIYYAFWTREWDVDFFPFIGKVKRLGFDQLEINGGTFAIMAEAERRRLIDEAENQGIVLSYGIGLTPDHDVSSLDESVRQNGIRFMKTMIEAVGKAGGGMIGGTVHSSWPSTLPAGAVDKRPYLERSLASIKEYVKTAEDNNVILNVEVINRFEQYLLNTCAEALAYVGEVNSPACGILLDTFHMNIEEDSISGAIRSAGEHLSALHLGETNRKPPGLGAMPWREIGQALDDIGFDGPLVMEPFITSGGRVGRDIGVWRDLIPNPDYDALARESAAFVRRVLC
ncbi:MAG TPA: sugar phosphate isomerase/epimerase family protein [Rectinemataceae bacterium]|nr:sugar phosphate isomerase/epimerase family protein [Rectinemataceae bacterium]